MCFSSCNQQNERANIENVGIPTTYCFGKTFGLSKQRAQQPKFKTGPATYCFGKTFGLSKQRAQQPKFKTGPVGLSPF